MIDWNFSSKNDQSRDLSDSITDSKFNIDPFGSFTREIIQNSLDVLDKENYNFVRMVFEKRIITLDELPGGNELRNVIKRCIASTSHKETLSKYEKALKTLESDQITCLKVSDYNTKGMEQKNWEALVNKTGESYKQNDSSAGRHGIGKKASFLMSLCNTVFYTSKNIQGEVRSGGKSILTDWVKENGKWFSSKGWFGEIQSIDDITIVEPIMNKTPLINDFFVRNKEYGTDVIIVALIKSENMEEKIINSLLENFYIGIKEGKLEVKINNLEINDDNLADIITRYYTNSFGRKGLGSDNIVTGLLKDYDYAYQNGVKSTIEIPEPKGQLDIYLSLQTNEARKYYSFYREHGMKIRDYQLQSDKPFAAVVVARGNALNEFLLNTENAAHDDFIADENNENYNEIKNTLHNIKIRTEEHIRNKTKLETLDSFLLEDLKDMITYFGDISKKKKNKNQKKAKKNELKAIIQQRTEKEVRLEWTKGYEPFDIPSHKPSHPNPLPPNPEPRPLPIGLEIPDSTHEKHNVVREISYEKFFVVIQDYYVIRFNFNMKLKNMRLTFMAKNVDGSLNDVTNMLSEIIVSNLKYKQYDTYVAIEDMPVNETIQIKVKLKNNSRYKLLAKLQGVEDEDYV